MLAFTDCKPLLLMFACEFSKFFKTAILKNTCVLLLLSCLIYKVQLIY